jgi:SAM-dependent methyltransferase
LAEVFRVLRPGGLFALTDISVDDLPTWPRPVRALASRQMDDMPTLDERDRRVEQAGLRVLDVYPTLYRRWITLTLVERPAR